VRRLAGQHFVSHRTKGVDVRPRVYPRFPRGLLWRHVLWRAEAHSRLCDAIAARVAYGERDSKIGNEGLPVLPGESQS